MLDRILTLGNKENSVKEWTDCIHQGIPSVVFGVADSFKLYLTATLQEKILYITKDTVEGRIVEQGLKQFLPNKNIVFIPPKDETLYFTRAFSKDTDYERISSLSKIGSADIVITTIQALMQTASSRVENLTFVKGEDLEFNHLPEKLVSLGYERVDAISSKGSFSVRGDILDIYPVNAENPIRINFFGDTIESIKIFSAETRESFGFVDSAIVSQAVEFSFAQDDKLELRNIVREKVKESKGEAKLRLKAIASDIEFALDNNNVKDLSVLSPLSKDCVNLLDLLGRDVVIVIDEAKGVYEKGELLEKEFSERFKTLSNAGETFDFQIANSISIEDLCKKIRDFRTTALQTLSTSVRFFNPLKIVNPSVSGVADYRLDFKEFFTDVDNWLRQGYSVIACTANLKRAEKLNYELSLRQIASTIDSKGEIRGALISTRELDRGFVFHEEKLVVIGSGNLYARTVKENKTKFRKKGFFNAPEVGDYCVHETHGIGRVLGSKKITTTEGTKDYVAVEYSGGDLLYVPVEQMDILSRYLGGEKSPRLSKIGGKDFEHVKKRVKESIKKMSFDLKKLYNEREELKGFKFVEEKELSSAFNSGFPYELTFDQDVAEQEIEKDMTSAKVMDRLVCGDVGFGKTEVAFRAIFRAIVNGKQAAMLAPTTILTEQHYNTALARFKDFGIKIACLNRFKTPKQQAQIVEDLKNGKIDFVIGTHRLLGKDIAFKDLGILVLDEEQRFGVEHKEKIKLLKKNVDALTLTATPIPRTLHMSLSGIRAISTINTPPKKRLPVQTYVIEESEVLIKDAVTREINRGGQAFILYNRVETIDQFAQKIKALMPNVRVTVAHGQMEERKLENNILAFYRQEYDLLISTTIIENGIDLPKANTLIVIDADRLGLSTLYQLKGRVGRSDRLAYAYFTFKREKVLTTTAYERLNAIIEFTEMGSGIKIAMRDLEIRGAGNILGAEQHGHMDKIGYELYSKLLKEELTGEEEVIPDLDIRVTAFIPDSYIESNVSRMDAYKEIAEISSLQEEKEFIGELTDNFGPLPIEVENLINIAVVKRLAMKISASSIVVTKDKTAISFGSLNAFANDKLRSAIDQFSDQAVINMSSVPEIEFYNNGENNADMLKKVRAFLSLTL